MRQSDGGLLEFRAAAAEACGINMVESEFNSLMRNIVGDTVYQRFIEEDGEDYTDFQRDLKIKILNLKPDVHYKVVLKFPTSLLKEIGNKKLQNATDKPQYKGKVELKHDRLHIEAYVLVKPVTDKIVGYIQDLLKDQDIQDTEMFLMVGEFSKYLMVQEAVRQAFPNIKVIVPEYPEMAMMNGAVIYGHQR